MKTKERKNTRQRPKSQKDAVYTQPKPFHRNRFLLRLATVAAVVLALVFGMSIFFKVDQEKITVSGTVKYDPWAVREASGIVDGENLLTLSKGRISDNIMSKLPYIRDVRIGRELPDTVHIQVTELEVVYAVEDSAGEWWLISADGRIVEQCAAASAEDYTKILGVQLSAPEVGSQAAAYEPVQEPDEDGETVPVTVYAGERLQAALQIMQNMEKVGMMGVITSLDVTELEDIQMWYGTRFQMLLGDSKDLYRKVDALKQAVDQMDTYDAGTLDASFTFWPTEVGYTPFS
ncbi:MAG: FtsQ-type POTRA domain-containing protein [Oscillospiraceae bacterium]|nr:FtsQ-type POTRA domain-containing protein [Oscillospiraceae bacterium]